MVMRPKCNPKNQELDSLFWRHKNRTAANLIIKKASFAIHFSNTFLKWWNSQHIFCLPSKSSQEFLVINRSVPCSTVWSQRMSLIIIAAALTRRRVWHETRWQVYIPKRIDIMDLSACTVNDPQRQISPSQDSCSHSQAERQNSF